MAKGDFHENATPAELAAWQRGWDDCREADRQQRGGDDLLQTMIENCSACDTRYVQKGEHQGKVRSISLHLRAGEKTNPRMQDQLRIILREFAGHCAALSATKGESNG